MLAGHPETRSCWWHRQKVWEQEASTSRGKQAAPMSTMRYCIASSQPPSFSSFYLNRPRFRTHVRRKYGRFTFMLDLSFASS